MERIKRSATFDVLILLGRPASGKSEIVDFLQRTSPDLRRGRFRVAEMEVFDDFPMLWAWFEENHILSEVLGQPRLHTDADGYFLYPHLWHLLIERLSLEYRKRLRDDPAYHEHVTAIVEFSRGGEHGGYAAAFQHLGEDLLRRAGVVYVRVSFAESLRKNRRRFNPERPDSILEHALPDEKLKRLYGEDDWDVFSGGGEAGCLVVRDLCVPYAVFENEDDVTTGTPDLLAGRLERVLDCLWEEEQRRWEE